MITPSLKRELTARQAGLAGVGEGSMDGVADSQSLRVYLEKVSNVLFFALDELSKVRHCNEAARNLLGLHTQTPMASLQDLGFKALDKASALPAAANIGCMMEHYRLDRAGEATLLLRGYLFSGQSGQLLFMERYSIADIQAVKGLVDAELNLASLTKELSKKERQLTRANDHINRLMMRDTLTNLYNRRTFFLELKGSIETSVAASGTFGMAVVDVDSFKDFNNRNGHLAGDSILASIADILKRNLHRNDYAARIGGERFAVVMYTDTIDKCMVLCDRMRSNIELLSHDGSRLLTVSVGLTMFKAGDNEDNLMQRADRALSFAKSIGKNRVVIEL